MAERRLTKSELRLRRLAVEEPQQGRRGILELFREEGQEQPDEALRSPASLTTPRRSAVRRRY